MSEKVFTALVWLVMYVVVSVAVSLFGSESLIEAFLEVGGVALIIVVCLGVFGVICNFVEGND